MLHYVTCKYGQETKQIFAKINTMQVLSKHQKLGKTDKGVPSADSHTSLSLIYRKLLITWSLYASICKLNTWWSFWNCVNYTDLDIIYCCIRLWILYINILVLKMAKQSAIKFKASVRYQVSVKLKIIKKVNVQPHGAHKR